MRRFLPLLLLFPTIAAADPVAAVESAAETLEARRDAAVAVGDRAGAWCLDPYVVRARQLARRAHKLADRDDHRARARLLATRERADRLVADVTPACPAAKERKQSTFAVDGGLYRAEDAFGPWTPLR